MYSHRHHKVPRKAQILQIIHGSKVYNDSILTLSVKAYGLKTLQNQIFGSLEVSLFKGDNTLLYKSFINRHSCCLDSRSRIEIYHFALK